MVAIGKVVFTSREHIIALEPRGKGLLGVTLRYPYEVRKEEDYFDDIPDEKIPKDMLDLASHIVKTKAGHFEPSKFEDQYEDTLKELLKKKQEGKPIERPERPKPTNVPCRSPATKKGRCRLHGGASGSGGPCGELNGQYRHGERAKTAIAERQKFSALLKMLRAGLT
jgi:hypothetical protein